MKKLTGLVVLLFFLSGASGLISELVWIKLLSQLLGGTTFAISAVLGAFMGGLALGSWRFGPRADRALRPLRLYARLELAVAATSLAVPLLLAAIRPLYIVLARALPEPGPSLVRILVAAIVVLPPTFFMGGTLPVLGRFLVRRGDRLGRGLGLLYAVNTLGAVAGAFLTGFVLIPALGLLPCIALAVAGNGVAGVAGLYLARRAGDPGAAAGPATAAATAALPDAAGDPPATEPPEVGPRLLAAVFALTGFAALGCELYWTRALSHFLGNTTYAFSAMLTTYLFGLAAGGWLGGRLADRVASPARLLGWTLLGSATAFLASVPLIWNWLPTVDGSAWLGAPQQPWHSYLLKRFLASAAVMVAPTLLSGLTFPLVNRIGIGSLSRLGRGVGRLYAANTAGAIAGSLAAGFLVLPLLGARRSLLATALLSAAAGVTVLLAARRRRGGPAGWPALAVLAALVLLAPALDRHARVILSDSQAPGDAVLFSREDPTAETRVYRKPDGELHMSVDGRHIGGTEPGIVRKEKILAHLPVALTPHARNVLAVGLGSGITLGALALYDEVERLTCVEIVPSVVEGARRFAAANHDVLADPRLHLVVGDGVQFLLTTRERFDVISSDSKLNPEFVGNSAILAREFYDLCREHLTERGVVIQWTATHLPNTETRVVTRTFIASFPYVELFWVDPSNVILVGSRSPIALDADRWAGRARDPAVRADLQSQLLDDLALTASYRVAGRPELAAALGAGPLNSWLRPVIEFQTVREFQLKPMAYHESDNLRWLRGLWSADPLPVTGAVDAARLARCRVATGRYLEAYSVGTGLNRLAAGRDALAAGLAANPGDPRLSQLLDRLQAESTAALTEVPADPHDANRWVTLGLRQLDARRPADALAAFDRALALQPGAREARYNRLLALRQLGRTAEVAAGGQSYTRDFPRDARGWSYHGRSLAEGGDLAGAAAAFTRAVELDPTTASYRNNLAVTLSRRGRWPEAAAAFAAVQALDPVFPDAAINAAAAYSRAGDQAEAWRWVETCLAKQLADPARLLADPNLAALRAAPQWDAARVAAARPPAGR